MPLLQCLIQGKLFDFLNHFLSFRVETSRLLPIFWSAQYCHRHSVRCECVCPPHLDCLSSAPAHQPFLSLPRALTTPLFHSKLPWSCSSWITSMRELVQYRWHFCGSFQLTSGLPEFHLCCHKWWPFVIVYMYLQSFLWVIRHSFLPKKHSTAALNSFSVPLVLSIFRVHTHTHTLAHTHAHTELYILYEMPCWVYSLLFTELFKFWLLCGLGNYPLSDANTLDHSRICPFTVSLHLCWAQGFRYMQFHFSSFCFCFPLFRLLSRKKKKARIFPMSFSSICMASDFTLKS